MSIHPIRMAYSINIWYLWSNVSHKYKGFVHISQFIPLNISDMFLVIYSKFKRYVLKENPNRRSLCPLRLIQVLALCAYLALYASHVHQHPDWYMMKYLCELNILVSYFHKDTFKSDYI